jgi:hypothetical protein
MSLSNQFSETPYNDKLHKNYIGKQLSEFWKSWNPKFTRNIRKQISINGCTCTEDYDIADKFAFKMSYLKKLDQKLRTDKT